MFAQSLFADRERTESTKYIYWQDQELWLGYLQDYPNYWTQGQSLEELEAHLRDLHRDMTSGEIPGVRKLADLTLRCSARSSFGSLRSVGAS
jgi:hypothetical protein